MAASVGARLKRLRLNKWIDGKQMSQDQLEEVTGIDRSYIGKIERGDIVEPGIAVLERLAEGLGVPVEALAPTGYYAKQAKRNAEASIIAMIWSDTTLTEGQRREAEMRVREIYSRRKAG
jgi:transcriptional regulator with XRE-family HTH domain